jgi:acyl carrier protein
MRGKGKAAIVWVFAPGPFMTSEQALRTVDDILATEFEVERGRITPNARLREDLGLDSLDAVDLVVALEKACGRRVPEETVKTLNTVGDVYAYVRGVAG